MQYIKQFIAKNERTSLAIKNVFYSFFLKGITILISFLLVPLTIDYLNVNDYGIWLTISSILTWINFFDIGLANGLRNKLTEAIAHNDIKLAKSYTSTTFALLFIIMTVFFIIFMITNYFLQWDKILNLGIEKRELIGNMVLIVFAFFCLQFVFKTVGVILISVQKPAYNDLILVFGNIISLLIIFILTKTVPASLPYVAYVFAASPAIVYIIAYFFIFFGKYKYLRPSYSFVDFKYTSSLINLGVKFFIIQMAVCIVIYTSTNILLVQLFGSKSVTVYNVAFKYFNSISMAYMIILTPFWSAATDAYAKNDHAWIRKSIKKLIYIFLLTILLTLVMIVFSEQFYKLWVGDKVKIPLSLSIMVAVYTSLFNWSNTFIYFINGIGKIQLQLYITVGVAIVYIPCAIFLGHRYGISGVVFTTIISLVPTSIFMPIQCKKIFSNKASGIWIK
ncbi:MAG: LPS biosynthesis flippase [Flavobacterium sp.]|nr:MAG: LPS biosynthesis flippase [Flavobacterium sp.]